MSADDYSEIFVVCCKNGRSCTLPDHAGTSWEDFRPGPYFDRAEAEEVHAALDDPSYWGRDRVIENPRVRQAEDEWYASAYCGPHSIRRFVPEAIVRPALNNLNELRNRIVVLRMAMREAASKLPSPHEAREILRDAVDRDIELEEKSK